MTQDGTIASPGPRRSSSRRLPSLDALRAFEAAARRLSFTEAAAELHVTQGAVSQRIKLLEQELGRALFDRTPRGLCLTGAGETLAHGVAEGLERITLALAGLDATGLAGALEVSVLPSFATRWLVPRLNGFSRHHPEIEIRIHAQGQVVDLRGAEMDAAIRFGTGAYPGLAVTPLMGDAVVPACSPELIARHGPPRDIAALMRMPLLHDTPTETDRSGSGWPSWLAHVGAASLAPRGGTRLSQADLVIEAAMRGLGVALVRTSLAEADFRTGRLVRLWPAAAPTAYSYFFVCRPEALASARVRTFRDWLLACCQPLVFAQSDAA